MNLQKNNIEFNTQVPLPMYYQSMKMDIGYRLDILVENKVIIEIKSVEQLSDVHHKQVITYLKLSGLKLALLVNFNTDQLAKNIVRKVNRL